MADVALSVQRITRAGIDPTNTGSLSVANTYQFVNDGNVFLHVINGGGSPDTVTVISQAQQGGLALADLTVSVPAGEERMIGPFPPNIFNDGDGLVNVTHSFITSVTHAALQLG